MKWPLATLLCLCILSPARGSENPRWLKITSPNFVLFTTAGERSGRDVARHFEQVRSFFLEAMGLGLKSGPPVRIVVFRSDKEFAPYSPNESAWAYYLGSDDRDYIIMKSASSEHFPVAVHEYTHLLVKHSGIDVPIWFNEGLAELYSNLKPLGGKVEVGDFIMPHYALLRQSKWVDLQTLLAVQRDSPLYNEKDRVGLFYAECWALVHLLYLDNNYRPKLHELLQGIKAGANMTDTFQKAYGKSIEEVQNDLRLSIYSNSFNASFFNTRLAKTDPPEVGDASPLEAGLVLAGILSNIKVKAAEGRAMYEQLARDYPKDCQVQEGLGNLSWREHKRDQALAHFGRAAAFGSTSVKMYLLYGRLLRVSDNRPEAVAMLKRATELDATNQEASVELGFAYVSNEQFAEAITQFKLVRHLTPEQAFGYYHALAYAYYRLDRKPDAKSAAVTCRKYARTPEQIERLDHLVEALNLM